MEYLFDFICELLYGGIAEVKESKSNTVKVKILCCIIAMLPIFAIVGFMLNYGIKCITTDIKAGIILISVCIILVFIGIYAVISTIKKT